VAAPAAAPVSLPETGSNSLTKNVTTTIAILAGSLAAAQLGIMLYRRLALK
jgi:hypothetical protein